MDNTLIIYLIKVSISLALFYILFMLFLRRDTFLKIRRFYFLFIIAFSLLFPLFVIEIPIQGNEDAQIPAYWLSQLEVGAMATGTTEDKSFDFHSQGLGDAWNSQYNSSLS